MNFAFVNSMLVNFMFINLTRVSSFVFLVFANKTSTLSREKYGQKNAAWSRVLIRLGGSQSLSPCNAAQK